MARVSPATQKITRDGLDPQLTAPTVDGDIIDAGNLYLEVANAGAAPITVTVEATAAQDGLDVADLVETVPAAGRRKVGPFPARTFARPAGSADAGRVYVNYSAVASVTRGVFALGVSA